MSKVFPRHCHGNLNTIDYGEGCYLFDKNGKQYLDGSGGAAVSCLGHNNQTVINAIKAQLDKIAFAHTSFFTSEPAEKLADLLIKHAPKGLDRVYFVSGGSEAVESSLKLARQYFLEIGQPQRHKIIARKQSYHGNTLGALAAGNNQWRSAQFSPLLIDVSHIAPCYEYRGKQEGETSFDYGQRVAGELEEEILTLGAENVMAFIAEPVVGATLGVAASVQGYFKRIREICDKYGILLILDEVMCGMGRTGSLFSCAKDEVEPDILCIAKGLGAGYQPIGAMIASAKIYDAIEQGTGFFQHGHTYIGHPTACAAGLAVVSTIIDKNLVERVNIYGEKLISELNNAFGRHPHIGDIRGRGLFIGLELVAERKSKTPFNSDKKINATIKKTALEAGLLCYTAGGTLDGGNGDYILLAPPFIIEDTHIDEMIDKLDKTFRAVL